MIKIKNFFLFWSPAIFWMFLIYWLSSFHKLQASPVGWQDFVIRKTAHFLEYAVLCLLYFRGLKNTTKISFRKSLFLAFLMAVFYALTDEFHQTKVNGRTGRIFDIGIDSLGAFVGMILSKTIFPRERETFNNNILAKK